MVGILDLRWHRCDNTGAPRHTIAGRYAVAVSGATGKVPFLPTCWRSRSMRICRAPACWAVLLVFVFCVAASAQTQPPPGVTTTTPELTMSGTLTQLTRPAGATHVGEALSLGTQLSIATAPFGASSGGFLIKLDPS